MLWLKKKREKKIGKGKKSLALFSLELVLIKKDWFYVTAGGERQFTANMFRQTEREKEKEKEKKYLGLGGSV